jgi:hypothetical protein
MEKPLCDYIGFLGEKQKGGDLGVPQRCLPGSTPLKGGALPWWLSVLLGDGAPVQPPTVCHLPVYHLSIYLCVSIQPYIFSIICLSVCLSMYISSIHPSIYLVPPPSFPSPSLPFFFFCGAGDGIEPTTLHMLGKPRPQPLDFWDRVSLCSSGCLELRILLPPPPGRSELTQR